MMDKADPMKDLRFLRGQVLPRHREILLSWVPLAALLLGGAVTAVAPGLPVGVMPISTILSNGFTFASIAMGACISAIVLSLGLPSAERLRQWAREPGGE